MWYRKSKSFTVLIICSWVIVITSAATAEELVGTIVSVDKQSCQLIIDKQSQATKKRPAHVVTVKFPDHMIFERPRGNMLPGWLVVGQKIKIKGDFAPDNHQLFIMTRVDHTFLGRNHDPTGVRSRIGRGCRRKMLKKNADRPFNQATDEKEALRKPGDNGAGNVTGEGTNNVEATSGFRSGLRKGGSGKGNGGGNGGHGHGGGR